MFNLRGIKALLGEFKCFTCNRAQYFSEKIPNEKIKSMVCPHYNVAIIFHVRNGIKIEFQNSCRMCFKKYNYDSKIGGSDSQCKLIKDDNYQENCCGNKIEIRMYLSEAYFDKNYDILNFINNFNNNKYNKNDINKNNNNIFLNNINMFSPFPMMNNGQNINMSMSTYNPNFNQMAFMNMNSMNMNMNNSVNNNNLFINNLNNNFNNNFYNNNLNKINNINNNNNYNLDLKFDATNVMEFNKKVKLLNFLDNKTNKKYQIYTSPDLKFKNVLNDLLTQFPEINYNNKDLELNGITVNLEVVIKNINLNDNSIIIIKTD